MTDDRSAIATPGGADVFRLLAENVLDYALFVIDTDRIVRTWGVGAERLLGYSESDIVGKPADVFFTPEDLAAAQPEEEVRQALAEGRGDDDRWHVRKDGTRFWSAGMLTPLYDRERRLYGFVKIMRDQTALKLGEDARREGEDRLRTLADNLPDGAVYRTVRQPDGRNQFMFLSAGVERLFGISAERAVADPSALYETIHEEDWDLVRAAEVEAERTQGRFDCEFRHLMPDGDVRWVHARSVPRRTPNGVVWEGVLTDATGRKRAEAALRESEEWLRLALEAGRMGTWEWDVRTGRIRWSQGLEEIHGLAPGSFDGTFETFQALIHPDDLPGLQAAIESSLRNRTPYEADFRFVRPDGSVGWMVGRGKAYHDGAGEPVRIVGVGMGRDGSQAG